MLRLLGYVLQQRFQVIRVSNADLTTLVANDTNVPKNNMYLSVFVKNQSSAVL